MTIHKAERRQAKLRIGLSGVSGSGKTYSALLLASGITSWDKICVIDTENGSGELYADLGPYNVITLSAPFTPEKYTNALQDCEQAGMEIVIVDSATHVWKGSGGLLEYQSSLGGRYQDWAKTTPRYQKWLDSILQSKCHVIVTLRKKQAYSMEMENGKAKIKKLGMEDEIRDGFEYEMTLSFNVDHSHLAAISKNRTSLFQDGVDFKITPETGKALKEWNMEGKTVSLPKIPQKFVQNELTPTQNEPRIIDSVGINTEKLKTELTKRGATIEDALTLMNDLLKTDFKSFDEISQSKAANLLIRLLQIPMPSTETVQVAEQVFETKAEPKKKAGRPKKEVLMPKQTEAEFLADLEPKKSNIGNDFYKD